MIASKFFTLLSGESALSSAARRCFAHALLDHPVDNSYNATIDSQIRQLFLASPPQVTLIQGAFRVDYILEDPPSPGTPKSVSTVGSSLTTTNGPTSLLDSVFASFTLHNEVLRCQREDKEQFARLSAFFLAALGESRICPSMPLVVGANASTVQKPTKRLTGFSRGLTASEETKSGKPSATMSGSRKLGRTQRIR